MIGKLLDLLFPPRADEEVLRDVSLDGFLALLSPVLVSGEPETVALLPFRDPRVRAAVHEAKYRGSEKAFALLAGALGEYLRDCELDVRKMVLVPVPLGAARRKERGFNQAEKVAKRVGKELGIAVDSEILVRTRETVSQISLPRAAREENMRGAFGPALSASPLKLYVLLDDVVTTGATLRAAAEALQEAGAEKRIAIALAH